MPNLTDGERCTRRSSRAYPQVNRRFGLLTEQEAHESRAARRPEGSRAMEESEETKLRRGLRVRLTQVVLKICDKADDGKKLDGDEVAIINILAPKLL